MNDVEIVEMLGAVIKQTAEFQKASAQFHDLVIKESKSLMQGNRLQNIKVTGSPSSKKACDEKKKVMKKKAATLPPPVGAPMGGGLAGMLRPGRMKQQGASLWSPGRAASGAGAISAAAAPQAASAPRRMPGKSSGGRPLSSWYTGTPNSPQQQVGGQVGGAAGAVGGAMVPGIGAGIGQSLGQGLGQNLGQMGQRMFGR